MLIKRYSSALIGVVILSFSLEFHAVLCALERNRFLMLMFLEVRRSVVCLNLPLANVVLELSFKARNLEYYRDIQACLTNCVPRARFYTGPRGRLLHVA